MRKMTGPDPPNHHSQTGDLVVFVSVFQRRDPCPVDAIRKAKRDFRAQKGENSRVIDFLSERSSVLSRHFGHIPRPRRSDISKGVKPSARWILQIRIALVGAPLLTIVPICKPNNPNHEINS